MRQLINHFPAILVCLFALASTSSGAQPGADSKAEPNPELRAALQAAVHDADSFDNRFDAEVWLLDMSTRLAAIVPDTEQRLHMLRSVHREAKRAELQPELVLALIHVESLFSKYAISSAGARGLMQVMPFWKDEIGRPEDNMFDIDTNLRYGCTILRFYLNKENGNLTRALARYNGSLGKFWYPTRVNTALQQRWYQR